MTLTAALLLSAQLLLSGPALASDTPLVASVLPASRSVQIGATATTFATIINAGDLAANDCFIAPDATFTGHFQYQTTDPTTNLPTGLPDAPSDIAAGAAQTFVLALQPTAATDADVTFTFGCQDAASAALLPGINTLWLASSSIGAPDIVALTATAHNDGIVHLDPATGTGAFAIASINLGVTGAIRVSVDTNGASLPVSLAICRTDPITGACIDPTTPTADAMTLSVAEGTTPTFSVFASSSAGVSPDPAAHRIFVRFRDADGVNRGSTSVAVERPRSRYANWSLTNATPQSVGMTDAAVSAVLDHVFTDVAVQGALLVKAGSVVGERYANGFGAADLGTSWSVAKSFYAAAVGAALADGTIRSLDDPVSAYVAPWQGTTRESVTIRELLRMRAGLPGDSNGCGSIFLEVDQTGYALTRDLVRPPGAAFEYSNCDSQIIEPLLLAATGTDAKSFLTNRLLTKIGIDPGAIGIWSDPSGVNPMTYCCIDMTIRDFARFGVLMARQGEWDGEQLLGAPFVQESLAAADSFAFYGLHWWILNQNYFFGVRPPATLAAAEGFDGQWIIVWPEEDLVLVVLTQYAHPVEQGYVLGSTNFPDTCTARNSCPGATGTTVSSFDQWHLVQLLYQAARPG